MRLRRIYPICNPSLAPGFLNPGLKRPYRFVSILICWGTGSQLSTSELCQGDSGQPGLRRALCIDQKTDCLCRRESKFTQYASEHRSAPASPSDAMNHDPQPDCHATTVAVTAFLIFAFSLTSLAGGPPLTKSSRCSAKPIVKGAGLYDPGSEATRLERSLPS